MSQDHLNSGCAGLSRTEPKLASTNGPDVGFFQTFGAWALDWTCYLFRFEGRITRAKYWLAGLIILCWMIFALMLLDGIGRAFGYRRTPPCPRHLWYFRVDRAHQ